MHGCRNPWSLSRDSVVRPKTNRASDCRYPCAERFRLWNHRGCCFGARAVAAASSSGTVGSTEEVAVHGKQTIEPECLHFSYGERRAAAEPLTHETRLESPVIVDNSGKSATLCALRFQHLTLNHAFPIARSSTRAVEPVSMPRDNS